ncbi:TonB-dependent siderophore receptor [Luteolibacter yonseiensis]|uniref:TonB-dependent siderophore receptor n=1 Tax=Luteolibacter yonseiensis TaxID=1144680 RepID=A0A934R377_9BACT|nr:TonB-dependent siderophore receptor [Luteolibacter yonseiensis]MBK1815248.1 TonB-dependent siderophore receptor [Luteolibacter yonseiensis]
MKRKQTIPLHTTKAVIFSYCLAATSLMAQTNPTTLPSMVVVGEAASPILYQTQSSSAALFSDVPLIETPFSVSVYGEQLIEDQRAFTLKEVLENDPSVAIQMPGGFYGTQNLALRGFQVDNFNGYRVDGLPMIQTVSPYLDDKSRVELLKGPAALRFGFMPPGGAINLVRKRPTQEFATSLSADINTFGSFYSQVDASDSSADGKFGYRVVLADEEYDSFYDNADGERRMGSIFLDWKPTEAVDIWASFGGQKSERNGYYGPMITANGKVLDTGYKTNIMQDWAFNDQEILDAAIGADIKFNEDWKLRTSFNYQDTSRDSALSYPYSVADDGSYTEGALLTNEPFEWDSWGAHAHVEGVFDTGFLKHNVVAGSEYRTYDSYGERSFPDVGDNDAFDPVDLPKPAPGPSRVIDAEYEETSFFLTDTVEFTEQWSALAGVRYGKYENTFAGDPTSDDSVSEWSPTAALMYEPVRNVHTYVTYAKGMQDGGFADRTAANAFAPLGVQESEQWEVGVKTEQFDGRLAAELALFQIEQDLSIIGPDGIDAFNGLQRHRGVELSVRGKVTDQLQAGFAAMLLDAEQVDTGIPESDGKTPQYVPEYQVNLWSVLEIPQVPGLALTANVRFVDSQYLDQQEEFATDNYTVVDLGARYRFQAADADWTVRLKVENVLDERYYESGEYYKGDAGYLAYGSPVAATLSLQVDF